jgi:hypothetical protein
MSEIEVTDFQQKFPYNMGYIAISGVGFNRDQTQAVFYIDHFCGPCGGGRYVTMEKVNGSWHVREEHYTYGVVFKAKKEILAKTSAHCISDLKF